MIESFLITSTHHDKLTILGSDISSTYRGVDRINPNFLASMVNFLSKSRRACGMVYQHGSFLQMSENTIIVE